MSKSQESFNCDLSVDGMHCAACEALIEERVAGIKGVKRVKANLTTHKISLELDHKENTSALKDQINKIIEKDGYKVTLKESLRKFDINELLIGAAIATGIFILFLALQKLGIVELFSIKQISYPSVFLIGVFASFSSCMAVVGSLVLTLSSKYSKESKVVPIVTFHIARIIAFFLFGGIIGYIGSRFLISKEITFALDIIILVVMVLLAFDLIGVFPYLSKFSIQMPKIFGKKTLQLSESTSLIAPILVGMLTFFLPCGFTQSMQVYALSTGSFLNGALVMGIFALGTFPALALISVASHKFASSENKALFYKTSGVLVFLFAIMNFIAALTALGVIPPVL